MAIKYECYNSWNAFNSLFLRLYKALYVVFVCRLGKYIVSEAFVLFLANG